MMKISFELSDKDLRYFRQVLQKVRKGRSAGNEEVILREAEVLLEEVAKTDAPQFVRHRIAQLGQLIEMLEDADWRLEGEDRKRVLNALAYFADPDDLIPDRVPGLGYLDDAIMVELVVQDLKHEIEAFEAFVAYRRERRKKKKRRRLRTTDSRNAALRCKAGCAAVAGVTGIAMPASGDVPRSASGNRRSSREDRLPNHQFTFHFSP